MTKNSNFCEKHELLGSSFFEKIFGQLTRYTNRNFARATVVLINQ